MSLTVCDGTLSPTDPAGILFPADLAEPVTIGVIGLADAGMLFPAVSEGILLPTDPGELLSPVDHVEPCAVGVTDLDESPELGTFAGKMKEEARGPLRVVM